MKIQLFKSVKYFIPFLQGCPVKQDIFDSSIIIAEGDGLIKGLEDHQTTFYVDPRGQKGELKVQVEG